jgi:hypothetical protein
MRTVCSMLRRRRGDPCIITRFLSQTVSENKIPARV